MSQSRQLVGVPKGPRITRDQATMLWLDLYAEGGTRFKLSAYSKKKMGQRGKTCGLMIVGRGISSRNDSHTSIPLPERPEEVLPFPFIQSVSRALDSYLTSSIGGESASTEEEQQNVLVMSINNGWTTGNSTERSSLFSWGDDEFDKLSAKRVQRMFDEIDSMLYEGQKNSSSSSQLHNECKVWKARFPHLRILGSQLIVPSDEGFQLFPQDEPSSMTTGVLLDIADHEVPGRSTQNRHGLTLSGHHIYPIPSVDTPSYPEMTVVDSVNTLEEEIIESDGTVEEFFAYDNARQADDHERKVYHTVTRREGFPPLTPNACVQNTVLSQTFDVLWAEVVTWMRSLIKRHQEDKEKNLVSRPAVEPDHPDTNMTPIMAPTYVLPLSPSPLGVTAGRLMDPPGKLAPMGSFRVGPSAPFNWQAPKSNSLTGVMTISSKALHTRQGEKERVPSAMIEESPALPATLTRPNSSSLAIKGINNRPNSTRMSDVHGHRLSSARGGRSRLRPIERVKTPNVQGMDALITGKRMMTANDRLNSPPHPMAASPPHQWSRNTMLPPIESVQENGLYRENQRPPTSSGKRDFSRHRISSAVIDDRGQRLNKNLQPFPYNDSRPNTTHSFRSDMMLARRSSTPQSITNILKAASGTMQGVPGQLNDLGIITGRGINPGGLSQLEGNIGNSQYGSQQQGYLKTL
ncbi:protein FAM149B1-like isoform X2 [Lytechinus pictus]|uniref:protein FAM149B1-like isoform X2 n=1 Tax=Lytechinus pictus TaxID=7653 RepID=UPI0030BA0978